MTFGVAQAVAAVVEAQEAAGKPLAVIVAGHNGSGKSTFWYAQLAPLLQIPLINADRLMLSILPEVEPRDLPDWAKRLRDTDDGWMRVAQLGAQLFIATAREAGVEFATETVFSHLRRRDDGTVESKADTIRDMQDKGYFVLLVFVGLSSANLSLLRVQTRVAKGGHAVPGDKLIARFPRTQQAVAHALDMADAVLLADNSRTAQQAFTPCHLRIEGQARYDIRTEAAVPAEISAWLEIVAPR